MIAEKARRLDGVTKFGKSRELDININRLAEAALVLDWCNSATANSVITGDTPLSKAVGEARRLKKEDENREAKKSRLRSGAPDLLARVGEERATLEDAMAVLEQRRQDAKRAQRVAEIGSVGGCRYDGRGTGTIVRPVAGAPTNAENDPRVPPLRACTGQTSAPPGRL